SLYAWPRRAWKATPHEHGSASDGVNGGLPTNVCFLSSTLRPCSPSSCRWSKNISEEESARRRGRQGQRSSKSRGKTLDRRCGQPSGYRRRFRLRLERHDSTRWRRNSPGRVSCVDDQARALDDPLVVELGVVGENQDAVGGTDLLIARLDGLQRHSADN